MLESADSTDETICQLCVRPTGGGKSLLFTTLSACLSRMAPCTTPLLSLGADQTMKHQQKTVSSRNRINSVHSDKIPKGKMDQFVTLCRENIDSFSIIVRLCPQSLIVKDGLSKFLTLLLNHKQILKLMVTDEVHLINDFERSFRNEFQMLKNRFFSKAKADTPMLLLIATCTSFMLAAFDALIDTQASRVQ